GHLWYHRPFFFSSRGRHTRFSRDWSSDVCSSDLPDSGKRVVHKASLPRVSQPRSNSVDGQVNGDLNFTFHRFCFAPTARSGAQTPKKLNLQTVKRIHVSEALVQSGAKRLIVLQQFMSADQPEHVQRQFILLPYAPKNCIAQLLVWHQFGIALCNVDVDLGENLLHVRQQNLEEGPGSRHVAQQLQPLTAISRGAFAPLLNV